MGIDVRRLAGVLLALALGSSLLGLPGGSLAAATVPTWLSTTDLSVVSGVTMQGAGNPEVAIDDRGDAVAVWWRSDGTNWRIQAATRSAESYYWSMPVTLSQAESGANAFAPKVGIDAAGDAVVALRNPKGCKKAPQLRRLRDHCRRAPLGPQRPGAVEGDKGAKPPIHS